MGIPYHVDPFISLSFMALPVIPSLRLTDRGLFDVDTFAFCAPPGMAHACPAGLFAVLAGRAHIFCAFFANTVGKPAHMGRPAPRAPAKGKYT